jgi:phosphatidylserine/phosphatidylglycerophosphate/cardiolipin synthase-like enzyme
MAYKKYTKEQYDKVIEYKNDGFSAREVESLMDVPYFTIQNWFKGVGEIQYSNDYIENYEKFNDFEIKTKNDFMEFIKLFNELDNTDLLKRQTSPERAKIIEDNNDALKERIRMISQAKEEIILSTFDFRSDDSGKLILGALIDAADRGVSVNVIVDGVSGFLRMRGNAYFEALAAMPEATVKIYNKVNPLKSYKSMGRLHDKYIVIDRQNYILGGRNTFNYFLGDNEGHKNYDRDVLVYCAKTDENSSVNQLIDYYDNWWKSINPTQEQTLKSQDL